MFVGFSRAEAAPTLAPTTHQPPVYFAPASHPPPTYLTPTSCYFTLTSHSPHTYLTPTTYVSPVYLAPTLRPRAYLTPTSHPLQLPGPRERDSPAHLTRKSILRASRTLCTPMFCTRAQTKQPYPSSTATLLLPFHNPTADRRSTSHPTADRRSTTIFRVCVPAGCAKSATARMS